MEYEIPEQQTIFDLAGIHVPTEVCTYICCHNFVVHNLINRKKE